MIAQRLKQATHPAHVALEGLLIPAMKQVHQPESYATLLRLFYGYYQPLEALLEPFTMAYLPDFAQRRKAALILDDLRTIGATDTIIPQATALPTIHSLAQALGALYVLEGSTLGGTVIAKMLGQQLGTEQGLSFFRGYGATTGSMWKTFIDALNAFPASEDREAQLIQAANDTFNTLKHWTALHYGAASFATEKL